ncbi:hypothetical protein J32TS6_05280 [Virgibacillus pantothenticus]|uniref:hypothetical protein n=1 Tax=Virgibacillus pantothenticus TaxID=1473 RepID=UPI001B063AC1|nr:hypothetical protein [Virgibacillus pantothenticus]GIP61973.1 hypothetical protein J32TS6_05280 [Virgibacillus pantothenticus]
MDFNVRTQIQQSEINGLYNEMEELKKKRKQLKESIDDKEEKIISHILKHGNVIAYKNDDPHVLTVKNGHSTKFDKSALANDLGVSQKELDYVGVAEFVESKQITSQKLNEYYYQEPTQKLNARKAKKADMDLILGGRV